jgi:hypothetical protein
MRLRPLLVAFCLLGVLHATAAAQPDIPKTPHPRLLLDDKVRASWKALAKKAGSPIAGAVERCKQVGGNPSEFSRDGYMGLDWAGYLQNCLVAWAATGNAAFADTAMKYFIALIDDLQQVGDGKGGNEAGRRDSGYTIRALGPYTALAYDWLHDHPKMTEAVKARARERWEAWLTWYLAHGYRARSPSTNYHAGYLIAATFIAIAQNNEAGKYGNDLWRFVRDDLWGRDMKNAMDPGGALDGGDWGEGWQYAPLSVASYALAARVMTAAGSEPPGMRRWLDSVLMRHVHALSPGAGVFVGGDTQAETANIAPNALTLSAVVLGDASPDHQAWAAHEIQRLKLGEDDIAKQFVIFGALAAANPVKPVPVPRDSWPTYYIASGVSTLYARSHWTADAVWTVLQCSKTVDVDHMHPNAGNIVISRGSDDVIVDPSPYGTLSSLTSNAPTVESKQLPDHYKPSQAYWSVKTGFRWAHQTASGIVTARCDYADQYKFQDNPSDVPAAQRDVVVFPWDKGQNAVAIIVDRAASGDPARGLHLRFRTMASLTADGNGAVGDRGGSGVSIRQLWASGGKGEARSKKRGDCFSGATRGGCDIPRFPIDEWALVVPGPAMEAAHAIDVVPYKQREAAPTVEKQGLVSVVTAKRGGGNYVVAVGGGGGKAITYRAAAGTHAVLDAAPDSAVTATPDKGGCAVTVGGSAGMKAAGRPAVFTLDAACVVTVDGIMAQPLTGPTAGGPVDGGAAGVAEVRDGGEGGGGGGDGSDGSIGTPQGTLPRSARSGCCGAQATPGSPIAMALLVLTWIVASGRSRSHRRARSR